MNTLSIFLDRPLRTFVHALLWVSLLAWMPIGCTFDGSALGDLRCTSDSDCPNNATCVGEYCVENPADNDLDAHEPSDTRTDSGRDVAPQLDVEPALDVEPGADASTDTEQPDVIPAPTCTDDLKNGDETGTDCGGPDCGPCRNQESCVEDGDCASNFCHNGVCQAVSCTDGEQNGDETDIDCGGTLCEPCEVGGGCELDTDCEDDIPQGWGECQFGTGDEICVREGVRSQKITEYFCNPSSSKCQEGERTETDTQTCVRETAGEPCGTVTYGGWGACEFDENDICGLQGEKTREVYTPSCAHEMCAIVTTLESAGCSRDTDGDQCGEPDEGDWGACEYTTSCANTGTRTKQVTTHACSGGSCVDTTTPQTDTAACARNTNGDACTEIPEGVCEGGSCVECVGDSHCAANAQFPYCQSNLCVECKNNDHCDGEYVDCKMDVNQCVQTCRNNGHCSSVPGTTCQGNWCLP